MFFANYAITCDKDSASLFHPPMEPSLSSLFLVSPLSTLSSSPTFNWRAPFRVYAHLLARKRRTERVWGRLWEMGINGGGGRSAVYSSP